MLSEFPALWKRVVNRWRRLNRSRKRLVEGQAAPGANQEYLFYQTLIGTWPLRPTDAAESGQYRERIQAYMLKAVREAKLRTSWANVRADYEAALHQFIDAALDDNANNLFVADLRAVQGKIARLGLVNSLAQTLCKLTAPGVPDIYQGTEIWDCSLVDPDNRRAVDYRHRSALLAQLEIAGEPSAALAEELVRTLEDGRAKLHVIRTVLGFRRRNERLFTEGDYMPATARGAHQRNICAFLRRGAAPVATLTVFPRLCGRLGLEVPLAADLWGDTMIEIPRKAAGRRWSNLLDGSSVEAVTLGARRAIRVSDAPRHFPVALLLSEATRAGPATATATTAG